MTGGDVYLYECPYGHQTEAGRPRTVCQHAGCGSALRRIRADGTRWPEGKDSD
jgi:hypothetical protein